MVVVVRRKPIFLHVIRARTEWAIDGKLVVVRSQAMEVRIFVREETP